MSNHIRLPSLNQFIIWLFALSVISFTLGGVITTLYGGNYTDTAREKQIPVTILRQDAQNALISLEIEGGTVNVTSGDQKALLSGVIRSKNAHEGPFQSYMETNGTGMLTIRQETSMFFDPLEKEDIWDLTVCPDIPVALSVVSGTGDVSIDAGSASLTGLNIKTGTGDITLNLTGWNENHLPVTIEAGLGDILILLPKTATIGASTEHGLGSRTITGFEGADGRYYHTSPIPGASMISLSINQGLGDLTMKVLPEGI